MRAIARKRSPRAFEGLRRLRWALAVGAIAVLALASSGSGAPPNYFKLGQTNVSNQTSTLTGSILGAPEFFAQNTASGDAILGDSADGRGLLARHTGSTGNSPAIMGQTLSASAGAIGVLGTINGTNSVVVAGPNSAGVEGTICCGEGAAVRGIHGGDGDGVFGSTLAYAVGVRGESNLGIGVYGKHLETGFGSTDFAGVQGDTNAQESGAAGVLGRVTAATPAADSAGVRGVNPGSGYGIAGRSASGAGVFGESTSGLAGLFNGDVVVTGMLTKAGGSFKIDDPLAPATRYLSHSFVESPDMMNVYNGNVVTGRRGFAVVTLPRYFQALNRDFRYQLTIVGKRGWRARVVREITGNRFTIQTDERRVKVSWQVTGIRKDRWANAHRIPVEQAKPAAERGTYLHPELYRTPR